MPNDVDHLFMSLLAIHRSILGKCLFKIFPYLKNFFGFFFNHCILRVHVLDTTSLSYAVDHWTTWIWIAWVLLYVDFFSIVNTIVLHNLQLVKSMDVESQILRNCINREPTMLYMEFWLHRGWVPLSSVQFSSVPQSCLTFANPWITACHASLSSTNSRSLPKLMSIESVMPSNHVILCRPLLLLPPVPPSIRVFSNESTLLTRWPKYWSFSISISPSMNTQGWSRLEWTGWISLQSKGLSRVFSSKMNKSKGSNVQHCD